METGRLEEFRESGLSWLKFALMTFSETIVEHCHVMKTQPLLLY
jgi:hypothetical protein